MANIKSQKTRVLTNEIARQGNASAKAEARTAIKKVEALVAEGKTQHDTVSHHNWCLLLGS